MDYAFPGRPTFTDVWGEVTKLPVLANVRFGQWKQPFSLEVVSSFRFTTFAERSVLFQAFTPFRHIAVGMYDWSENECMTWAASVYRPGQDQFGDQIADSGGYAGVGRVTYLPWYDEESGGARYLHVGAAYNYVAPANRLTRFRTIPEYFIGETAGVTPTGTSGIASPGNINGMPFFVDTKSFGVNHYNLFGTELLFVEKQFSLQTEFMFNHVDRTNGMGAYFPGMYVTGGYFLTGEHRPYLRKAGAIDRVKVLNNFGLHDDCWGWGAWELATRYSYIDLNSKDIQGGRLNDVTVGLNWYINSYVKTQFNYIRSMLDNPMTGRSNADIFGLRAQVDF
jgi:phosphate-selective porin OprO/OprP